MIKHEVSGGNGVKLYVEESGNPQGQAILFIHGFSQGLACWTKQVNSELAEAYRLVCFDLRGHGKSDKPNEASAYADSKLWADDVAAVIESLNLQNPVVVAWSYGGAVICDYVGVYGQDKLGAIVFVDATVHVGTPEALSYLKPAALAVAGGMMAGDVVTNVDSTIKFLQECLHKELATDDFYLALGFNMVVPPNVRQALLTRNLDNTSVVEGITIPALVIHGEEESAVSPKAAKALHAGLKNSDLLFYSETRHIQFLENPARFNSDLDEFIKRVFK
jgi:pimeloyl-ACP methyl ester carboxylesterase